MSNILRSIGLVMIAFSLIACGGGNDAKELRNRVTVATQGYQSVNIISADDLSTLEADRSYTLELWANSDTATAEHTVDAVWSSSDSNVAIVTGLGVVTGLTDGIVTIRSEFGSLTDSVELRVSSAPLSSIAINDIPAINECDSTQLTALGTFEDDNGDIRNITGSVDWYVNEVSDDAESPGVFSNSINGLFRSSNAGAVVVRAVRGDISADTSVTILDNLAGLTLSRNNQTVTTREATQFSLSAIYADIEETLDITDNAQWSVSSDTIADIDNALPDKGQLNASQNGDVTVQVSCGGQTGSELIAIGDPNVIDSIKFSRQGNPLELNYSGSERTILLRAMAVLENQNEVDISTLVDWITDSRTTQALSLSNESGSKGQLAINGTGTINVRIRYDTDNNNYDEDLSVFNEPTLKIVVQ